LVTDPDEEVSARRLGQTVGGRWLLERVLGVGGMGTVYAARNQMGMFAAVKMLHPEMSLRREIRERFLREGYVANHIGHAGVVQALEHGDTGDEVFLVMELLAGETLSARVKRHGKLPVGEVLDYADQILDVLAAAHTKGVVHRDLKPDNLFVTPDGRIKILDFGLARVLDGVPSEHRTRTGVALGTLAYMAPEQALGRRAEIDGRVDVFALGATMFRILTGRRVHEAESEAELLMAMASRPAPPLAHVIPGISPAVAGVVDLALAFSRDARYPDARTMQGDVRALRQGQPGPYSSARLSAREEATRTENPPTTSQRTQPLSATMQSNLPGTSSTLPMPAHVMGAVAAPGYAVSAPASVRTAPLAAHAPGPYGVSPGIAPGPASFASTMPSTQPHVVAPAFVSSQPVTTPAKPTPRRSLALAGILGLLGLAAAAFGGAFYFVRSRAEASAPPAPSAVAKALPTATPTQEQAPAAPATPAVAESDADTASSPLKKSPTKKDSSPAPSASGAATLAPSSAPITSPAAPTPAAPSASAAATAISPPPPAPALPSVAPPVAGPTSPATEPAPPPPPKKNRGRGRND
jgi:serine/threonine-protein kinase